MRPNSPNLALVPLITCVISSACVARADVRVEPVEPAASRRQFDRLEWKISLPREYQNPFDPNEIAVDATLTAPDGKEFATPCFWKGTAGAGSGNFALRFAPPQSGKWRLVVSARDAKGITRSEPQTFDVERSDQPGFLRRTPGSRYLSRDSGRSTFLVGANVAWVNSGGLDAYDGYFRKIAENGGNFARVWMSHPQPQLETKTTGVGRYDEAAADYFDKLFALAEKHGVLLMVTFLNHRDLLKKDMWGAAQWPDSPYNAANNGPCATPGEFVSKDESRELFKRRLRYVVARYGAFTSVAFWELWNEQDYTNVPIPASWSIEMAGYLRGIDAHRHLITTSFGRDEQEEVWRDANIDLVQTHYYGSSSAADCTPAIRAFHEQHRRSDKPMLVGELGIGFDGSDQKADPKGVGTNMHNGLWASAMSGGAGGAMMWWWDNYLDQHDLWKSLAPLAKFTGSVDWTNAKLEPVSLGPVIDFSAPPDAAGDVTLSLVASWKRSHGRVIQVHADGRTSDLVPAMVFGPEKAALRAPTLIQLDLPRPGKFHVNIDLVSNFSVLRVFVDDQPKADWFFSALPGMPDQEEWQLRGGEDGTAAVKTYFARINKQRSIDLPAGKHVVELRNVAGDWISLDSIRIENGRPARHAPVQVEAMHDAERSETVLWLHDTASNWKNDLAGKALVAWSSLELNCPADKPGAHRVEWWDTRTGEVINSDRLEPIDGKLNLRVPTFSRDVAAHVYLAK